MNQEPKDCVSLKASEINGKGLFARHRIAEGEKVIEYAGAIKRWSDYTDKKTHYASLMGLGNGRVIDPRFGGNIARYINHCCSPNCEALIIGKKVFICSTRTIEKNEELTIDYCLVPPDSERKNAREKYACACGSANCRGTMLMIK